MRYRKKPVVIEATQWFVNGDHPDDYAKDRPGFANDDLVPMRVTAELRERAKGEP